jgi:hypothetical protein
MHNKCGYLVELNFSMLVPIHPLAYIGGSVTIGNSFQGPLEGIRDNVCWAGGEFHWTPIPPQPVLNHYGV